MSRFLTTLPCSWIVVLAGLAALAAPSRAQSPLAEVLVLEGAADEDEFGQSVSTAGDVNGDTYSDVLIGIPGANGGAGRVELYYGGPDGLGSTPVWSYDGQPGEELGYAVHVGGDIDGDGLADLLVGAPRASFRSVAESGRVLVFLGALPTPASQPSFILSPTVGGGFFGWTLGYVGDFDGDDLDDFVIGAPFADNVTVFGTFTWAGEVQLWRGSTAPTGPVAAGSIRGSVSDARLGQGLGGAGDVNGDGFADLAVGVPGGGLDGSNVARGEVRIYFGGTGALGASPDVLLVGEQQLESFGRAVHTAGDVDQDGFADLVVGAPNFKDGFVVDAGRARLYRGGPQGPDANADWSYTAGSSREQFGAVVATAGDVNGDRFADVIVGSPLWNPGSSIGVGRARLFLGSPTGLSPDPNWTDTGSLFGSAFGGSAATAGDVNGDGLSDVVVGAWGAENSAPVRSGTVTVYHGQLRLTTESPTWSAPGDAGDWQDGVATAGDVNGDGLDELLVFSARHDAGSGDEGRLRAYYGGYYSENVALGGYGLPDPAAPNWEITGSTPGEQAGAEATGVGDVNGDGYDDVLEVSSGYSNPEAAEGRLRLYSGGPSGLATSPSWTYEPNVTASDLRLPARAGDLNGDGLGDFVVWHVGGLRVWYGAPGGPAAAPDLVVVPPAGILATSVDGAADVNGDGYDDVLLGLATADVGTFQNNGLVVLYAGGPDGLVTTPLWQAFGGSDDAQFGYAAGAGDVNGDGYADVLLGSPSVALPPVGGPGFVALYHGSASGPSSTADAVLPNPLVVGNGWGRVFDGVGDLDGDGYADVAVGARGWSNGPAPVVDQGTVFVHPGAPTGLVTGGARVIQIVGDQFDQRVGSTLAGAGDLDGDGRDDLAVGSQRADTDREIETGRVDVHRGAAWTPSAWGKPVAPRTQNGPAAPIARGGRSESTGSIGLGLFLRTAAGRIEARPEYVMRPWAAAPLPDVGTELPWLDTGGPTAFGSVVGNSWTVPNLLAGTEYRWKIRIQSRSPYFPQTPWFDAPTLVASQSTVRTREPSSTSAPGPASTRRLSITDIRPNPFNPRTQIALQAAPYATVDVGVFDLRGRQVRALRAKADANGGAQIVFDGTDDRGAPLASGTYLVRGTSAGSVAVGKLVLVR